MVMQRALRGQWHRVLVLIVFLAWFGVAVDARAARDFSSGETVDGLSGSAESLVGGGRAGDPDGGLEIVAGSELEGNGQVERNGDQDSGDGIATRLLKFLLARIQALPARLANR